MHRIDGLHYSDIEQKVVDLRRKSSLIKSVTVIRC